MHVDAYTLFNTPEPFADAGWCGRCAVCAAVRRRPSHPCGCPAGHRHASVHAAATRFELRPTVPRSGAGPATPSCLHAAGRRIAHGLYWGADLRELPALKGTHVLSEAVAVHNRSTRPRAGDGRDLARGGLTHHQAVVLVSSHLQRWVVTGDLSGRTVTKTIRDLASLAEFMTSGRSRPFVAQTTSADVALWVDAPLGGRRLHGQEAAATTRRLRRGSARLYFRVLRSLGVFDGDPPVDIAVHPGVSGTTIPATDLELIQLRYTCTTLDDDDRLASCLAIAEAAGSTGEMARVEIDDVDLVAARIWLRGDSRRLARWVPLSPWAVRKLGARIAHLQARGAGGSARIVYGGIKSPASSESPGASTAGAMADLMRRAGLSDVPGLRPSSIGLGFALRVWTTHRDIRLVAKALGYRSLDKAATAIGVDVSADLGEASLDEALRTCVLEDRLVKHQIGKGRRGRRR